MKIMGTLTRNILASEKKHDVEHEYWMNLLSGFAGQTKIPYDFVDRALFGKGSYEYQFSKYISGKLLSLCNYSEHGVFVVVTAGLSYLISKCSGIDDILLGTPLLKDESDHEYPNSLLALRINVNEGTTFKSIVQDTKEVIMNAYEMHNYPLFHVFQRLGMPTDDEHPLFHTVVLLKNIHNTSFENNNNIDIIFEFSMQNERLAVKVEYNQGLFQKESIQQLTQYLSDYLQTVLEDREIRYRDIDVIPMNHLVVWKNKWKQAETHSAKADVDQSPTIAEYRQPETELEKELAAAWRNALDKDKIGIFDNFFSLGGDSIKAIRLVNMLWFYEIKVKDIYSYPTIAELSKTIKIKTKEIDQEMVYGEVPLAPIQICFFEQHKNMNVHHYNQSMCLFREEGFNEKVVVEVFKKIIEHHDVLRMKYFTKDTEILQINTKNTDFQFSSFNYANTEDYQALIFEQAEKCQRSMNIYDGRLLHVCLFHTRSGSYLLVIIHHLVIDGVSWRILLEDFNRLYQAYANHQSLTLPPKTNSYKEWSRELGYYANGHEILTELPYWEGICSTTINNQLFSMKSKHTKIARKDMLEKDIILSTEDTSKLKRFLKSKSFSMDGILLAIIGMALKQNYGACDFLIDLEGHGREEIYHTLDITRTIGWFTTIYPVNVKIDASHSLEEVCKSVDQALKSIPNKGLGYTLLKYLRVERDYNLDSSANIRYNYLGEFDKDFNFEMFKVSDLKTGDVTDGSIETKYLIDINALIINDQLCINMKISMHHFSEVVFQALTGTIVKVINELEVDTPPVKEVVLEGFEPFNDVFYKDCFYNAFFSVLKKYGRNIEHFLVNDLLVYGYDEANPYFIEIKYEEIKPLPSLANQVGISLELTNVSNDIVNDIRYVLMHQKACIVQVDVYYSPERKDTFQKKHWSHTLLVYGYNDSKGVFYILEHSDIDALDYKESTITYRDLERCYRGALTELIKDNQQPTLYVFDRITENNGIIVDAKEVMLENIRNHVDAVQANTEKLKSFANALACIAGDKIKLKNIMNALFFSFRNILIAKKSEKYKMDNILGNSDISDIMYNIVAKWEMMTNIIEKINVTGVYKDSSLGKIVMTLESLSVVENQLYQKIMIYYN